MSDTSWIRPDWPAPARVGAFSTTRLGGCSGPPWDSMNIGTRVEDDPGDVARNRALLLEACSGAEDLQWLHQVHGTRCVRVTSAAASGEPEADGCFTRIDGIGCAITTADCLPVLFCDRAGTQVAGAHAGWRGLAAGVLESSLAEFDCPAGDILAWLGPCIGPDHFEVGGEVREAFLAWGAGADAAFRPSVNPGRWMADLCRLARLRLETAGVVSIHGGGWCTVADPRRFYSFRRDGQTGRMASVIWLRQGS